MTSDSQQPENNPSVIEELTAYLDGELDPHAMQLVEQRLGEDPEYQSQMQSLQKTWDLLDMLPSAEPGTSFTKTTMEMIVGEAAKDANRKRSGAWIWPIRVAVLIAVPALLFASSYGVIRKIQTDPDRILVENFSVIDNHYRYSIVDNDIDFLSKLNARGLFSDTPTYIDVTDGFIEDLIDTEESTTLPQTTEDRRTYIQSLDVEQKKKLRKKLDDYLKLSDAQKEDLASFDNELNLHEDRDQLFATMNSYYDWLKTIESGDRSRLLDHGVDNRIREISKLREQFSLSQFDSDGTARLPSKEDARFIFGWYEANFDAKEKQIRNHFPAAFSKHARNNNLRSPPMEILRRKARSSSLNDLVRMLLHMDRDFIANLVLNDNEMQMLYQMLSPAAKNILQERTPEERKELVLMWVDSANQSKSHVSIDRLRAFEKTLSVKERDELDKMSREGYINALRRKFRDKQKSSNLRRLGRQADWESFIEGILPTDE